jgi:hypothetical protein
MWLFYFMYTRRIRTCMHWHSIHSVVTGVWTRRHWPERAAITTVTTITTYSARHGVTVCSRLSGALLLGLGHFTHDLEVLFQLGIEVVCQLCVCVCVCVCWGWGELKVQWLSKVQWSIMPRRGREEEGRESEQGGGRRGRRELQEVRNPYKKHKACIHTCTCRWDFLAP